MADFTVYNDSEFTAAISALAGTGGTILLAQSGVFTSGRVFQGINPAAPLIMQGESYTARPNLTGIQIANCSKLQFVNMAFTGDAAGGQCVLIGTTSGAIEPVTDCVWDYCEFAGNTLDPFGDYATSDPYPAKPTYNNSRYAFRAASNDYLINPTVTNCAFHDLYSGIAAPIRGVGANGAGGLIEYNSMDRIVADRMSIGITPQNPPHGLRVRFNRWGRTIGRLADAYSSDGDQDGGPHSDGIQFDVSAHAGDAVVRYWDDVVIEGNLGVTDTNTWARGGLQSIIVTSNGTFPDPALFKLRGWKVAGNFRAGNNADQKGPYIQNMSESYLFYNRNLHAAPGSGANTAVIALAGSTGTGDKTLLFGNIAESYDGAALSAAFDPSNVTLHNTTASYNIYFDSAGYGPITDDLATALAFRPKAGSPLAAYRDYVDYSARTIDRSLEPAWVMLKDAVDQPLSTAVSTGWRKVFGAGAGAAISVGGGGEYRRANSRAGAGATAWTSAPGTVIDGQFVELRITSGAANGWVGTPTLTIKGRTLPWTVRTPITPSIFLSNGGAANSRAAMVGATTTYKKLVIALLIKPAAIINNALILSSNTTGANISLSGTGKYRYQWGSSASLASATITVDPTAGQEDLLIIAQDYTKSTIPEVLRIWRNGALAGLTSPNASTSTNGTITAGASGANMTQLRLFSDSAAANLFSGQVSMLWMHFFGAGDDITALDPAMFTEDHINDGGAGRGPFGMQPMFYYRAAQGASAWNNAAGVSNLGSVAASLIKQAGTWTDV